MRKYDVQELLRQEKNNVYQHILTIFLAIILGVSASSIFEGIKDNDFDKLITPIFVLLSLLIMIVIWVYTHRKSLIKIRDENFLLLTCFDMDKNPKPIVFNDYPFSVYTKSNWDAVIGNNNELIEKFLEGNKNYTGIPNEHFNYKVISDLVQYLVLREISPFVLNVAYRSLPKNNKYLQKIPRSIVNSSTVVKFVGLFRKFGFIDRYYKKRSSLQQLFFLIDGIPIISLPNQIKENIFVKNIHHLQIEYEYKILIEGKSVVDFDVHRFIPLSISLPENVDIHFEESKNSTLKTIILTKKKVGTISIEFHNKLRHSSQRSFIETTMKPGNHYKHFKEYFFEVTIDFNIRKYAYFPLIGGGEKAVDDFFSWGTKLIENIEKSHDWNYYQEHITRDLFQDLRNKLDYTDWESRIEYYDNFDDSEKGDIERLLRLTISPNYENKKAAIKQLAKDKNNIPASLLEKVILRIIRLTHSDLHTNFIAIKALTDLLDIIPSNLHEPVVNRLLELIEYEDREIKFSTIECLSSLIKHLNDLNLKDKIGETIINLHLSKTNLFPRETTKAFKSVYLDISDAKRSELEEKYYRMLKSNSEDEIIQSLLFYECALQFVSNDLVNKIYNQAAKLNLINAGIILIQKYIRFLFISTRITDKFAFNEDTTQKHFENIISIIDSTDDERLKTIIYSMSPCGPFISVLSDLKRDVIYYKLKRNVYSENDDIKHIALETICYLSEYLPGKEEEISELMLEKVDPTNVENFFEYIVSSACFDKIKDKVRDRDLLDRINHFQEVVNSQ